MAIKFLLRIATLSDGVEDLVATVEHANIFNNIWDIP